MPSKDFPLHTIVEVYWQDANGLSGWKDISVYQKHTVADCRTVGYLLKKTKQTITIALSQCDNEDINQAITIPTAWINKLRVIRK